MRDSSHPAAPTVVPARTVTYSSLRKSERTTLASATSAGPAETTASADGSEASSEAKSDTADQSVLREQGISTFLGRNEGAIASWYHTNSGTDSTNGRSWCEFPYNDSVPGFAPSLKTMLSSFGDDAAKAKEGFCGLEARVYSPKTDKTLTMYIADAFDDTWVRTPSSIDVIYDSFADIFGSTTDNKDDVVKACWWELTGGREEKYTYKGVGVG
ncbi:uncharacterized protein JCM10292_005634 [Rhodotorula paludigena]|uniref:uncharacterized protein n=1 Tax=Rhodotorula paludigena TaxID=86838 RepID=UPI00317F0D26